MKEIKTNKEFQAVGREITAAKKQVSDLEESLLQKISQIDILASFLKSEISVRTVFVELSA